LIGDMPRPRLPHLHRQRTRHGTIVWYVRRDKGPRIRIRGAFGSPEFKAAYHAAMAGEAAPVKGGPSSAHFCLSLPKSSPPAKPATSLSSLLQPVHR